MTRIVGKISVQSTHMVGENGAGLTTDLCRARAEECRALAIQSSSIRARVMLSHIADTWERIAKALVEKD
jgi:hypothetical protein